MAAPTATSEGKGGEAPGEMTSAEFYFDSNSHFGTHEELLKDGVRMKGFRRALNTNQHIFKDKIVLDIGAGTGILSMLAVKSGAKHVYGVESSGIIHIAKEIVKANKMSDKITLIKGKMEEVKLPVEKVDIIICDWMGYMLIQESLITTVIKARDKYLRKGGVIFPDRATVHICGIEDADYREQRIDFWDNVYGFNMSCMKEGSLTEPLIDMCQPQQVITSYATIHKIDLATAKLEDLKIQSKFQIASTTHDFCHALVLYFDVYFSKSHKPISISTGPRVPYTHWKQSVLYLDEPIPFHQGEKLNGTIALYLEGDEKPKTIIELETDFNGKAESLKQKRTYKYG